MIEIRKISSFYPILIVKNFFPIDKNLKEEVVDIVLKNKKKNSKQEINFVISEDPNNFFGTLYSEFTCILEKIFGTLTYLESNSPKCYCYVTNNQGYGSNVYHDHLETSTLNGVYYLNVPENTPINSGSISFNYRGRCVSYKPHNYDLLLFPNYLEHKINFSNHAENRISVNMEVLCEEDPDDLFFKILECDV